MIDVKGAGRVRAGRAPGRSRRQPAIESDQLHERVTAGLTENASAFGRRDAVQAIAADARRGLPVAEVLERTSALLASEHVIPVVGAVRDQDVIRRADGSVAPVPTGERRWSTPELLAVEERLVAIALQCQYDGVAVVPGDVLEASLRASLQRLPSLGADQVEMAARLATSGAGVECVEAAPGTGKTTALGVYVAACRRAGLPVIGCAPSARARDELRLGARIDACYTVDKLLLELRRSGLPAGSVVILDEASMPAAASWPGCSTTRPPAAPRWSWSGTRSSSRRSTPAAASGGWSPAWVPTGCWRTGARSSRGSGTRCATCSRAGCERR